MLLHHHCPSDNELTVNYMGKIDWRMHLTIHDEVLLYVMLYRTHQTLFTEEASNVIRQ